MIKILECANDWFLRFSDFKVENCIEFASELALLIIGLRPMGSATIGFGGHGPLNFRENQSIFKIYNKILIILTLWPPKF